MTVTELPRHRAPEPGRQPRWVPTRAGILNVWRYYDEVFEFHHGRLLLRGENGTGKSKALELLLPFLFDANLRANRLSTFGTSERTMHWNLMGDGASGTTRVGYTWLEFHLPGEPGTWFCCGVRLAATTHTTGVHADYFTTELRIGEPDGLLLVNDSGAPLTKPALEAALGERGTVHANATDYRAAVRAALFPGLPEQRYDALITALLQLRTPKLSQRLDPALLSTLLSRALPPLGQGEVADLAEGFERLDRHRERLAGLDAEVEAARQLAQRQRTYARRVLRAAAAALTSATAELDRLSAAARASAEEHDQVVLTKQETETLVETLEGQEEETGAQIQGLVDSDEYKEGRELDRLRQAVAKARERAADLVKDAAVQRGHADEDTESHTRATEAAAGRELVADSQAAETRQAATRAGLGAVHEELAALLVTEPETARRLFRAAVRGRLEQIEAVRAALAKHGHAVGRREQAEQDLEHSRTERAAAKSDQGTAEQGYAVEMERFAGELREWALACRELRPTGLSAFVEDEARLLRHVADLAAPVEAELLREDLLAEAGQREVGARRDGLVAELAQVEGEQDLPPEAPATRTTDRTALAGAPLWRLVRFVDGVPEGTQAAVEAALQAAGLLDAWVGATGVVAGHDVFAEPDAVSPAPAGSLLAVLEPEPDSPVAAEVVTRLLGGIAFAERLPAAHPAAIGADGSWRLATAWGSWGKPHVAHIGAAARAQARQRRAVLLRTEIGKTDLELAALAKRRDVVEARRAALRDERAACPPHDRVRTAKEVLDRAELAVVTADGVVRRRLEALADREREVGAAQRELSAAAVEHGVPAESEGLDKLGQAVKRFEEQAQLWLEAHRDLVTARATAEALARQAARSEAIAAKREAEATAAKGELRARESRLTAVESTVGVGYQEVLAELATARERLTAISGNLRRARAEVSSLAEQLGALGQRRSSDVAARDEAASTRDVAARRFRHLCASTLPEDSELPDLAHFQGLLAASEGVRAALDTARLVVQAWPTLPHAPANLGDAAHRLSESVHECRTALSARADLDLETDEDVQLLTAVVDGVRVGAAELLTVLRADAEQSRDDITERERQLFDQTLTGDTRRHLAARIRAAGELVDAMNARLERVRTASKVAVQLVWQVAADLPPGTRTARDLLLKDPVHLTEADRESLHRFFRERIEQARADDTATSWEQQLAQVFDYTAWHQFVVKVDRANGAGWQLLTRKLHGALSGGEKAIALHLPLFAAVAAHYQAVPSAPRIILLDEVFVGVDSNNRGQVFALLSALDLDLMLTSDHEWCTYAELSGVAIHQLITGGDDAVTTARFVWTGADLVAEE
ncbi:uncharacterized protein (TIGR02680 family) [Crossiella equi]|uniref:Uncharacterized protein (TIGR02680 family) n=1 Tax=Crossiella equi TaxID=130796 RepID=A0ABS5A7C4_9PSEU|nr:TIGR02680 family protein [Crossiella equi]MBP2472501.1 uncharacterized protein (TIGR02680 family) [Crossiella equi]